MHPYYKLWYNIKRIKDEVMIMFDTRLPIKMSNQLKEDIKLRSESLNMSMSEYVRKLVIKDLKSRK